MDNISFKMIGYAYCRGRPKGTSSFLYTTFKDQIVQNIKELKNDNPTLWESTKLYQHIWNEFAIGIYDKDQPRENFDKSERDYITRQVRTNITDPFKQIEMLLDDEFNFGPINSFR